MGWFSKKEEVKKKDDISELPDLPELPELPKLSDLQSIDSQTSKKYTQEYVPPKGQTTLPQLPRSALPSLPRSALPSLPNSSFGERFNREAVKTAVEDEEEGEYSREVSSEDREVIEQPRALSYQPRTSSYEPRFEHKVSDGKAPIFVRIDKFEDAMQSFEEIKKRIGSIETLLRKSKELKERESEELSDWEKGLESIKAKIDSVDRNIFSRIE